MLKDFAAYLLGLNKTGETIKVEGHNPIAISGTSLVGLEAHAVKPYRAKVEEAFISMQAFVDYLCDFKTPNTIVVGSVTEGSNATAIFKATLNYHGKPENTDAVGEVKGEGKELAPEWADQTVTFKAPVDPDFKAWLDRDGRELDQRELYNFLVDYQKHFLTPTAADVLTIAGKMKVVGKLEAESNVMGGGLDTLVKETKMLEAGDGLTIPEVWEVQLPVFRGVAARYVLPFRVLWGRDHRDGVKFRLQLVRPHTVVEVAFNDAAADIAALTQLSVYGQDDDKRSAPAAEAKASK